MRKMNNKEIGEKVTKEILTELYLEKGLSGAETANILGVSESLIWARLRVFGIQKGSGQRGNFCETRHKEMMQKIKNAKKLAEEKGISKSLRNLAKIMKVNYHTIHYHLHYEQKLILNKRHLKKTNDGEQMAIDFKKNARTKINSGYLIIRLGRLEESDRNQYASMFSSGQCLEHRFIYAKHLGRPLEKFKVVHHIDGNKTNNQYHKNEFAKLYKRVKELEAQLATTE